MPWLQNAVTALTNRIGAAFARPALARIRAHQKRMLERITEFQQRNEKALARAEQKSEELAAERHAEILAQIQHVSRSQTELRLRLTRLERAADVRRPESLGAKLPIGVEPEPDQDAAEASRQPAGERIGQEILDLRACPACGHTTWTTVCEYNKFLILESAPDARAALYDYSLCHACGIVFARHRPVGERYRYLLHRFEEVLGRLEPGVKRDSASPLSSGEVDEAGRRALLARAARGVFVSEHTGVRRREYLPALIRDRLVSGAHVETIGSLVAFEKPRVLELRPRFGSIGAGLQRLYGADVYAMPLFEVQQLLIREVYGFPADHLLDYDHFSIPYNGPFDLVVANHLMTHALRPAELLATVRSALKPGGHLYLYNEPDEADFLQRGKWIFSSLNPFHVQTFDGNSLVRALAANGFEPVFVTHHEDNLIALARRSDQAVMTPVRTGALDQRLGRYRAARDRGILRLPDRVRERFAAEWPQVIERAFAAGHVDFDDAGRLRMVK